MEFDDKEIKFVSSYSNPSISSLCLLVSIQFQIILQIGIRHNNCRHMNYNLYIMLNNEAYIEVGKYGNKV